MPSAERLVSFSIIPGTGSGIAKSLRLFLDSGDFRLNVDGYGEVGGEFQERHQLIPPGESLLDQGTIALAN